eukprot:TRINITY_DN6454_c0_g2_i1.p1 TRINITY_DN6454_c0_g2~~TRINITY_DN6454_c0_g2_i1.p1  ORF type:complete len:2038 (+),score=729.00 TRINITY_DN6454_c0_g2_i1:83-6196(+)
MSVCAATGLPIVRFPGFEYYDQALCMRIVDKISSKGKPQKRMAIVTSQLFILSEISPVKIKRYLKLEDIDAVVTHEDLGKGKRMHLLIKNREFDSLIDVGPGDSRNPAGQSVTCLFDTLRVVAEKCRLGYRLEKFPPETDILGMAQLDKDRSQGYDAPHKLARQSSMRRQDDARAERRRSVMSESSADIPRSPLQKLTSFRSGSVSPASQQREQDRARARSSAPSGHSDADPDEMSSPVLGALADMSAQAGSSEHTRFGPKNRVFAFDMPASGEVGVQCAEGSMRVVSLVPGSPAEAAGLRVGHKVVGVCGSPVASPADVFHAMQGRTGTVEVEALVAEMPPFIAVPRELRAFENPLVRFVRVVEKVAHKGGRLKRVAAFLNEHFVLSDTGGSVRIFLHVTEIREAVTQWIIEKSFIGPPSKVLQVVLRGYQPPDVMFVQTPDDRNNPCPDHMKFVEVLMGISEAVAAVTGKPAVKWTHLRDGESSPKAALKKPDSWVPPRELAAQQRSMSQMSGMSSGGTSFRRPPPSPPPSDAHPPAPAVAEQPEEVSPPVTPSRLARDRIPEVTAEEARRIAAEYSVDSSAAHQDCRRAAASVPGTVVFLRVVNRVCPSRGKAKRVLAVTQTHVALTDFAGAVKRFIPIHDVVDVAPSSDAGCVHLRCGKEPDLVVELAADPRNDARAVTPVAVADMVRRIAAIRQTEPAGSAEDSEIRQLCASTSSIPWAGTTVDMSGPDTQSESGPKRSTSAVSVCPVSGLPVAPVGVELAPLVSAYGNVLFARYVQKVGHRGKRASRVLMLTHNRILICEPTPGGGGDVKRFVRVEIVTDMIVQELGAAAGLSLKELSQAGGFVTRVLLKVPTEGPDILFDQVPDPRNLSNDQNTFPNCLRDLMRKKGLLLRERCAHQGEDLIETTAQLEKPSGYSYPKLDVRAASLFSGPEEQDLISTADALHQAVAGPEVDTAAVLAALRTVRTDSFWNALLQCYLERHRGFKKGDLQKALADTLSKQDLDDAKSVLRQNGIESSLHHSRGLSLAPIETLVRRASFSPSFGRDNSRLDDDMASSSPSGSPVISPLDMPDRPAWLGLSPGSRQGSVMLPGAAEMPPGVSEIQPPPGLSKFATPRLTFVRVVEKQARKHRQKRVLALTDTHLMLCEQTNIKRYAHVRNIREMVIQEVPGKKGFFGGKDGGKVLRILLKLPEDPPDVLISMVHDPRNADPDDPEKLPRLLHALTAAQGVQLVERRVPADVRLEAEAQLEKPQGYMKPAEIIRETRRASLSPQGSQRSLSVPPQQQQQQQQVGATAAAAGTQQLQQHTDTVTSPPAAGRSRGRSLAEQVRLAQEQSEEGTAARALAERLEAAMPEGPSHPADPVISVLADVTGPVQWKIVKRSYPGGGLRGKLEQNLSPLNLEAAKYTLQRRGVEWEHPSTQMLHRFRRAMALMADVCSPDNLLKKMQSYSFTTGDAVAAEMEAFARRLQQWYDHKPGSVVDELAENLRLPTGVNALDVLACAADSLYSQERLWEHYPGLAPVELLVLRQYTQRPVDVDRDCGWDDVPPPQAGEGEGASQHLDAYERLYTSWDWDERKDGMPCRNGSIFGPVCAAMRDQGPGGKREAWSEKVLRRWIKWLCTVSACCVSEEAGTERLYRGLGGGGVPVEVVDRHRSLSAGSLLGWPALSSCSLDQDQSRQYMHGAAANSTAKPTPQKPGTIFITIREARTGLPLERLSQYKAEAEQLFGPLTLFEVRSVAEDGDNTFGQGLSLELSCKGPLGGLSKHPATADFFQRVRRDARAANDALLRRVEAASDDEEEEERAPALPSPPLPPRMPLQTPEPAGRLHCHSEPPLLDSVDGGRRPPTHPATPQSAEPQQRQPQPQQLQPQQLQPQEVQPDVRRPQSRMPHPPLLEKLREAGLTDTEAALIGGLGVLSAQDFGLVTFAELSRVVAPVAARRALQAAGWQEGAGEASCCVPRRGEEQHSVHGSSERALRVANERIRIMGLENNSLKETISCLKEQIQIMKQNEQRRQRSQMSGRTSSTLQPPES